MTASFTCQYFCMFLTNRQLKTVFLTFPGFFFPWPAKYKLYGGARWEQGRVFRMKIRSLIQEQFIQHKSTYEEGVTRDFIDAYFQEAKLRGADSSFFGEEGGLLIYVSLQIIIATTNCDNRHYFVFSEFNLQTVLLDMFVAGAETTSTTLLWSILYLTQNPEVQKKVQEELDAVIGDRPASRDDKSKYF